MASRVRNGGSMSTTDETIEPENVRKLLSAIKELHHNLGTAFNDTGERATELWPVSRNGLVHGLVAIALFCRRLDGFDRYAPVFNEFSSVLSDLDYGIEHSLLTQKERKGSQHRPSDSTDIWCARCRVAIAIKYLISAGQKKTDIVANITRAKKYRDLKWLVQEQTRRAKLSSSIVTWYEEFSKGGVKNQEARDLYRTFMHLLNALRRQKKLTKPWLESMANRQLVLAAGFKPITKDEVLRSFRLIEPKRPASKPARNIKRERGN